MLNRDTNRCATVIGALAAGETFDAVEEAYHISRDQILAALRYDRRMR